MAAQRRGAARLDGGHDAAGAAPKLFAMGATIGLAVAAEEIRHLERRLHRSLSWAAAVSDGRAG